METINIMIHCNAKNCRFLREDKTCRESVEKQKYLITEMELDLFYDNEIDCFLKEEI